MNQTFMLLEMFRVSTPFTVHLIFLQFLTPPIPLLLELVAVIIIVAVIAVIAVVVDVVYKGKFRSNSRLLVCRQIPGSWNWPHAHDDTRSTYSFSTIS
jgi:hypothetical protein